MKKSTCVIFLIVTILSPSLIGAQQKPENFSWIDDEKTVGGMAEPSTMAQIQNLKKQNVGTIITLTEIPLPEELVDSMITYVHIPIEDFKAPTNSQIMTVMSAIEQAHAADKAAVIHCRGGIGRTGTMLACWLVKSEELSSDDAFQRIRKLRSGSVETKEQRNAIEAYWQLLQRASQPQEAAQAQEANAQAQEGQSVALPLDLD